jgi:hypothetical protein
MSLRNLSSPKRILTTFLFTAMISTGLIRSFSLWDLLIHLLEDPSAGGRIDDNGRA